jgi:hypothetical protein
MIYGCLIESYNDYKGVNVCTAYTLTNDALIYDFYLSIGSRQNDELQSGNGSKMRLFFNANRYLVLPFVARANEEIEPKLRVMSGRVCVLVLILATYATYCIMTLM